MDARLQYKIFFVVICFVNAVESSLTVSPVNNEVPVGQNATFRCTVVDDNNRIERIDWLSNGQLIDFDQDPRMFKTADNSLIIINVTSELDSVTYTCVGRIKLSIIDPYDSGMLFVLDVPNPLSMVSVFCELLSATILWQPEGDNGSPIINFKIQFNTSFTPDSWEEYYGEVPATDSAFTVSMSPWANYTFRVIAHNKIGDSLPSHHTKTCRTPPDVPYKNPDDVVGKGTTPTNLIISWTPMPPIDHNAPGFFYRVYWKLDLPQFTWNPPVDIANWQEAQFEVTGLETHQQYRIKVEAHNSMGQANTTAVEVVGFSGEDVS